MSFRYGFTRDSRRLMEDEFAFSQAELDDIEERAGFSLSNTFDEIRETSFETEESETAVSTGAAVTRPEWRDVERPTVLEASTDALVDVVLEYEEMDAGTLAHEAVHARMMQPDGRVVSELPEDDTASQRVYGEFVAHLAEHRVEPLETDGRAVQRVWQARNRYEDEVDMAIEEAYEAMLEENGELSDRELEAVEQYQDVREQDLAAIAAEAYDEGHDADLKELMAPDEELYREAVDHIENVEDHILEYA